MSIKKLFLVLALVCLVNLAWCGIACGKTAGITNDVLYIYEPALAATTKEKHVRKVGIAITAASAVLMDADTGQMLYAKNASKPRPIASTTKIMTALVAIQCGNLKGTATVSKHAANVEGSSVYLQTGERLTLEELLYGALMHSGNDACVAIAEHVAGNEKNFVNMMNQAAHLLGADNTNFSNTNGLPDKKHLSTAYDLALITRYALANPVFHNIVSTKNHLISGPGGRRQLSNTNQMLWGYQGADGVKTGTTSAAGKCLVSSAYRDGRRLIAVVLHSGDRYADSSRLLDYGFENFDRIAAVRAGDIVSSIKIQYGNTPVAPLTVQRDLYVTVPRDSGEIIEREIFSGDMLAAPVQKNFPAGRMRLLAGGELIAETALVTGKNVDRLPYYRIIWNRIKNPAALIGGHRDTLR
ncbi:MAG: D-Ala-D-Ala carboxypeptidase [Peptococcaceae bacterium BRH_c4b]|nr:MAG: D-Ala-D-Ala carboxypeptidase [Peptococcaceae bacterium BRH_c4b]